MIDFEDNGGSDQKMLLLKYSKSNDYLFYFFSSDARCCLEKESLLLEVWVQILIVLGILLVGVGVVAVLKLRVFEKSPFLDNAS